METPDGRFVVAGRRLDELHPAITLPGQQRHGAKWPRKAGATGPVEQLRQTDLHLQRPGLVDQTSAIRQVQNGYALPPVMGVGAAGRDPVQLTVGGGEAERGDDPVPVPFQPLQEPAVGLHPSQGHSRQQARQCGIVCQQQAQTTGLQRSDKGFVVLATPGGQPGQ